VSDGSGCARSKETIKNQISGVGSNLQYSLKKPFWLRRAKCHVFPKESLAFFLGLIGMPNFVMGPPGPRNMSIDLTEVSDYVGLRAIVFAKINSPLV
jgi:hypothetical protein